MDVVGGEIATVAASVPGLETSWATDVLLDVGSVLRTAGSVDVLVLVTVTTKTVTLMGCPSRTAIEPIPCGLARRAANLLLGVSSRVPAAGAVDINEAIPTADPILVELILKAAQTVSFVLFALRAAGSITMVLPGFAADSKRIDLVSRTADAVVVDLIRRAA